MKKDEFEVKLNEAKEDILNRHKSEEINLRKIDETQFEELFFTTMQKLIGEKLHVEYKEGSTIFPDIGCPPYGVEIKTTKADKWVCLGNSIMEGTRRSGVNHIYIAFLKKGGEPDIRVAPYDDSISDIKVTHSPRYEVNMNISKDHTIFSKLEISYEQFRDDQEKIQKLRHYYQSNGIESWWLDAETGETSTGMELKLFGQLPTAQKTNLKVELFALFPEILKKQYGQAATYLIFKYGIFNSSFRDMVSAGGQEGILIDNKSERVSKSIANLVHLLPEIVSYINSHTEIVAQQWGIEPETNLVDLWFTRCETYLEEVDISKPSISIKEIYETIISKE